MAGTTFDPATTSAVTLSGGNLVATNTGTTSANQGAHAPSTAAKTTGKFYFECTYTTFAGGHNVCVGVGIPATSTYTNMGNSAQHGNITFADDGRIYSDSNNTGSSLGARSTGSVIGIAVDLINGRIWFRVSPSGNWNNTSGHDPTIGNGTAGGFGLPTGYGTSGLVPFAVFGGSSGVSGNVITANFGDSAFSGAVPSGYTSGWPSGVVASAQAIFFRNAFA